MTTRIVDLQDRLALTVDETGRGRPVVVIHGGGGPATVASITDHLADRARVLTPTLPGWNGTPRPERIRRVEDIARAFTGWLEQEDLSDVAVVGSSIGGWIAAELAVADIGAGRITSVALLDAVGFQVPGHPIRDFFALDARGVADYSYAEGDRFYLDPSTLPEERRTAMAANMATMRTVAGDPYMVDPALLDRVGAVSVPALAIWGDADRIVTPAYGRRVAEAFAACRFELVAQAGHLPHIEQPEATFDLLDDHLERRSG